MHFPGLGPFPAVSLMRASCSVPSPVRWRFSRRMALGSGRPGGGIQAQAGR